MSIMKCEHCGIESNYISKDEQYFPVLGLRCILCVKCHWEFVKLIQDLPEDQKLVRLYNSIKLIQNIVPQAWDENYHEQMLQVIIHAEEDMLKLKKEMIPIIDKFLNRDKS